MARLRDVLGPRWRWRTGTCPFSGFGATADTTGRLYTEWINSAEMYNRSGKAKGKAPGHVGDIRVYYVFQGSAEQPHANYWPDGFPLDSKYVPAAEREYLAINQPRSTSAPAGQDPFKALLLEQNTALAAQKTGIKTAAKPAPAPVAAPQAARVPLSSSLGLPAGVGTWAAVAAVVGVAFYLLNK